KTGTYTSLDHWETQTWNEKRLQWQGGNLVPVWNFESDWKPVPYGSPLNGPAWEPVFHAVLAGNFVYVPGAGGSIFKVNKSNGAGTRISPFGAIDRDTFTAGPLTADGAGNIYYTVLELVHGQAWNANVVNSWLVKVASNGTFQTATITSLTPGAPDANDKCLGVFNLNQLPWPPTPTAVPGTVQCGSQRVGLNAASPVVASDGSIFYGAFTRFNYDQGHIMKFSSTGQFLAAYRFGWDDTPALYAHDGTYSIITKDNQYGEVGSYCNDETYCPSDRTANNPSYPEAYFITRLNANLQIES